ncbi:MAG: helix-turn-helix domain-containing protein [Pseudomonadota bacterium]
MPPLPDVTANRDDPKSTKEFDKALGARVKFLRQVRGISQEKLADSLGLTFQQVQKYETGANRFPIARLVRIAHLLGCTASFFLGEDTSKDDSVKLFPVLAERKDILALIPLLAKASPTQIKALKAFLEADQTAS